VVTAKTAAAAVYCVVLLLVTWGITVVGAKNYTPDSEFYDFVALATLSFFILQMIFLALGIFLGCALKKYKRAGSIAMSILLGTYFISILVGLNKDLEFLKYVTPFKYFEGAKLLQEAQFEVTFVLLSIGIVVAALTGAYVLYAKRDLYI
jgi:ABC-2 type transport system permease protein